MRQTSVSGFVEINKLELAYGQDRFSSVKNLRLHTN